MSMATAEDGEAERITVRQAVQQHVVRLWDTDPTVAARAAESLFELGVKGGYASVVATRNRQEIGMMEGVFPGFAHLVSHGTDEGQGWACAALAQIAFDNANNCIAIVRTPGMLAGLRQVMENSTRDSKAAAALAVNNISAFSEQASAIIVQAEVLNLNEADMERLSLVGCLQEAGLAGAVWEHRQRHGPFLSWDALHNVAGMTGRVAERAAASRHPNLVLSSEPSLLPALQALCRGELTDARTDAVGALNHMSRSDQARRLLLHHSILHQALGPALSAEYESAEELAAIVARATMAIANLMAHEGGEEEEEEEEEAAAGDGAGWEWWSSGAEEGGGGGEGAGAGLGGGAGPHALYRRPVAEYQSICSPTGGGSEGRGSRELRQGALGILVRCLQYALKGEKWVGITWGTFSVLHALNNLSRLPANKPIFCNAGLVEMLCQLLELWSRHHLHPAPSPPPRNVHIQGRELQLALEMMSNLASLPRARHLMRHQKVVSLLEGVGRGCTGEGSVGVWHWLLRPRHLALAMGQHTRLGANSRLLSLDPAVMRLIVEYVCGSGGARMLAHALASLLHAEHAATLMVSG